MLIRNEALVWETFKNGDWDAYQTIYNNYFKLLNNYGYKFTRDKSLIEDAVHDLFVKIWVNRNTLGTPISLKNYLYKSLRGIIIRKLQKQAKYTGIDEEPPFFFEVSFEDQIVTGEEEAGLKERMKSVIQTLPQRQQEIIYLRFYEGFSYAEIVEIMDINISSVYKLLYKAVGNLSVVLKMPKIIVFLILLKGI